MSINKQIWNTEDNATAYESYASNFPMYKNTSTDLVLISNIKPGMTVVDLAAGTGVTTQAIFDQTKNNAHIIEVDQAEEMLKKAKEKFIGKDVQFIVVEAEDIDQVIKTPVDAVICNSAFWQIKPKPVFSAVSNILKEKGVFAFNLPDHYFSHKDFKIQPRNPSPYNLEDLTLLAKEVGLSLINETIKSYDKTIEETIAFNEIPVMKRNFKDEDERKLYFEKLQTELTQNNIPKRQWVYLVFQKNK